jgi:23S rRNA (cytidine2498-2'-O)-methyltransferase
MSQASSSNPIKKEPSHSSLVITRPSLHSALKEEIQLATPGIEISEHGDGVFSAAVPLSVPLALARLVLQDVVVLRGTSISDLAHKLFEVIDSLLDHNDQDWSLTLIEPSSVDTGEVHNRARLIEKQLLELLEKRRRGIRRRLTIREKNPTCLIQVVLVEKEALAISISSPEKDVKSFSRTLTYAGNYIHIEDDKYPPSRAFKKLVEARLLWELPFKKGQHAVDLGACPGGWTHIAQSWGLTVTAVDRSPLAEHLMKSRKVQFIKGDAFSWVPDRKIDWLLCDVISAPGRTKELLQRWITEKFAAYFCVTMKFKGEPPVSLIHDLKGWMFNNTAKFDVIPLTNNKHEITWVGTV